MVREDRGQVTETEDRPGRKGGRFRKDRKQITNDRAQSRKDRGQVEEDKRYSRSYRTEDRSANTGQINGGL